MSVLLPGALFGLGVWLVGVALRRERRPLAAYLADLAASPRLAANRPAADGRLALVWIGRTFGTWVALFIRGAKPEDLRLVDRSPERHLGEKVVYALLGLLLPGVAVATLALAGVDVALPIPLGASLVMAVAFYTLPDVSIVEAATARRREFRYAVMAFFLLVAQDLAGGAGLEAALERAANRGDTWPFLLFRHAVDAARIKGELPWDAFEQLGRDMGVERLEELASGCRLAGSEGARVRQSLLAQTGSMAEELRMEERAATKWRTAKMVVAAALGATAFMLLLLIPQLARIMTSS